MSQAPSTDLVSKIRKWLQKQGYPLEHRTAAAFARAGFDVRRGVHYEDTDGERPKRRETDVVALHSSFIPVRYPTGSEGQVEALIGFFLECKHNGGKPWVVFTSPGHAAAEMGNPVMPAASALGRAAIGQLSFPGLLNTIPMFKVPSRAGYSVVSALKESGDKNEKDHAYVAMQTATAAAHSWLPRPSTPGFPLECFILFPVVVTDPQLFECWFDEATSEEQVHEIDQARLYWHGATRASRYVSVDIITAKVLDEYARAMFEGCQHLMELLTTNMQLWIDEVLSPTDPNEKDLRLQRFFSRYGASR